MMDELLAQFIVEARDLVQAAIDDLFVLESEPDNADRLDNAFRAVHTLKGSVGLFDLAPLQSVLHRAEDHLQRVRSGGSPLDGGQIAAIVAVLEWIDACVDDIERGGAVGAPLLERAGRLGAALGAVAGAPAPVRETTAAGAMDWAVALADAIDGAPTVAIRYRPNPGCFFNGDDPVALVARIPALLHLAISPRDPWPSPETFDPYRANLVFEALSGAPPAAVEAVFRLVPDQVEIVPMGAGDEPDGEDAEPVSVPIDAARSLRVDSARIDALLGLVSELMTTKNGVGALAAAADRLEGGADLARAIAAIRTDLDRLVGSLYGAILQTRMVPVSQAFRRLPRMVRDLSFRLGKSAELVVEGDAIEADKTIVDGLFEPVLHLTRNAMDHGIETPAERLAAGKPATAKLLLRVARQNDQMVVSLTDDGRGIDPAAIRTAAIAKGVVTEEQATRLDGSAALELLFAAGFSTAATVSDLSGRGVGLDAVRSAILRLGGTVEIASRRRAGTTIAFRLPTSFALTQLMIIQVADERYGVPIHAVAEIVRVRRGAISPIRGNRAFVHRDRTIPLLSLSALLDLGCDPVPADEVTVLVLAVEDQHVGVVIDGIADRLETVTKPLGGLLTGVRGIAGTLVLDDGRVLLVLDVAGLIQ